MTLPLPAALRAAAEGLYTLEAATGLIIAHGTWLGRGDFARFIHHGTGRPRSTGKPHGTFQDEPGTTRPGEYATVEYAIVPASSPATHPR